MRLLSDFNRFLVSRGPLQLLFGAIVGIGSGELVAFLLSAHKGSTDLFQYSFLLAGVLNYLTTCMVAWSVLERLKNLSILTTEGEYLEVKSRYFRLMYASGGGVTVVIVVTTGLLLAFGPALIWVLPVSFWLILLAIMSFAWLWDRCPF